MGTVKKSGSGDGASKSSFQVSSVLTGVMSGLAIGGGLSAATGGVLGALASFSELEDLVKQLQKTVLINEDKGLQKKLLDKINNLLKGLKSSLKGTKLGCCLFGGDPVNLCTGNYITFQEDIHVTGIFPLSFRRFYNAMDKKSGVMGKGWTHNFEIWLKIKEEEIEISKADGCREIYLEGKHGEYVCSFGGYNCLRKTEDGYEYQSVSGESYQFDFQGKLMVMINKKGNKLFFSYLQKQLIRVENSASEYLVFAYDEGGHLTEVSDHSGRNVRYSYEDDCLCEVKGTDQATVRYQYDKSGLITAVVNQNNITKLRNTYDENERILTQKYADGGVQTFAYNDDENTVVFTEQNGNQKSYIHDEKFRLVETRYINGKETFAYNSNNLKTSITDRMGYVTRFTYDDRGNMTSVIDALQNKCSITYNAWNLPVSVKGPCGETTTLSYDSKGNLVQTEDALGGTTKMIYTSFGKPEQIIQADGSIIQIQYDAKYNIQSVIDEFGNVTKYEYDQLNRIIKTTDGCGYTTCYAYDGQDRIICVTNPEGQMKHYQYNKAGKVTKIVYFDGSTEEWEYDACDRVTAFTDKNGHVTQYRYDLMGNVVEVIEPNGMNTQYQYDLLNCLRTQITPLGAEINYEYDKNGNRTKVIGDDGSILQLKYNEVNLNTEIIFPNGTSKKIQYDAAGRITELMERNGGISTYVYDKLGQLISEEDALGRKTEFTYNELGKVVTITDPAGRVTSHEYYPGGLLRKIVFYDGSWEEFEYDANRNIKKRKNSSNMEVIFTYNPLNQVTKISSNFGQEKILTYDAAGNVTTVTDAKGNVYQYEYSKTGKLIKAADPVGNQVVYAYDNMDQLIEMEQSEANHGTLSAFQRVQKINQANKVRRISYKRNAIGQVTEITDASGNKEEYVYDRIGRMIKKCDKDGYETLYEYSNEGTLDKISYQDGKSVMLSYDALGKLVQIEDWLGITAIQKDILGRTESVTDYRGQTVSYEWGDMDEQQSITYPDGKTVRYEYDELLRLNKITDGENVYEYLYNEIGQLKQKVFPNGTKTSYYYQWQGYLDSMVHEDPSGILEQLKFTYDELGNKTAIEKDRKGMPKDSGRYSFAYDKGRRLTDVWKDDELLRHYEYDTFGNRTSLEQQGERINYQYNELNQLVSEEGMYKNVPVRNRYTYDKRGNLTAVYEQQRLQKKFVFDVRNCLEEAEIQGGESVQFVYNAFGKRVKRMNGQKETEFFLDYTKDRANLLMEKTQDKVCTYLWDDKILGMSDGQEKYYYLNDEMGSPLYVTGSKGTVNAAYGYDEFGNVQTLKSGFHQPIGFTGYQKEESLSLYYAQARYYSGQDGRFISEDLQKGQTDIPMSFNPYVYCFNMPTILVDPNGEWTEEQRIEGIIAHMELQLHFTIWCAATGQEGQTEFYIPGGVVNPDAKLYKNPKSGTGRADIVLYRENTAEVYEIKTFAGLERGKEQIQAYLNGIDSSTKYNAVKGTTYNPNRLELPYALDPSKTIVYYTDYDKDPGIIKYYIKKKKINEQTETSVETVKRADTNAVKIENKQKENSPLPQWDLGKVGETIKRGGLVVGIAAATVGTVILVADDATLVGALDDGIAAALIGFITKASNYLLSPC